MNAETGACTEQMYSPLRFFYSKDQRDPANGGCLLISAEAAQQGAAAIMADVKGVGGFFLSHAAEAAGFSNKTRSNLLLGSPLPGYKDKDDDKDAQGNLYELFYAGLDCKLFADGLSGEFKKYTGRNPCADKAEDFVFEGLESKLKKKFNIRGIPAEEMFSGMVPEGALRSGYMGADPVIETDDGTLEVRFWSLAFQQVEFNRVVDADLYYSILSIQVVFLYIAYHTSSFFLASLFMFQIVMSLPVGYFVYYNILQIQFYSQVTFLSLSVHRRVCVCVSKASVCVSTASRAPSPTGRLQTLYASALRLFFFRTLFLFCLSVSLSFSFSLALSRTQVNILAIYLALGIGADSVFVMVDCWNQARLDPSIRTTLGRLRFSLDRTVKACFNTTVTTVASFAATSLTPVMPIHCFAVFAAMVLTVDYIFMIFFAPTVMMLYHVHFSDLGGLCCCCGKNCKGRLSAMEPAVTEDSRQLRGKDACYNNCCYAKWPQDQALVDAYLAEQKDLTESGRMRATERFFKDKFSKLIIGNELQPGKYKPVAYLIIAVGFAYGAFMTWGASQLR